MEYSPNGRPSLRDKKNELRASFRELRKKISEEERAERSAEICKRLTSLAAFRFADTVLSYSPLPGEVDITEFNRAVLLRGKKLALPRCSVGEPVMDFHIVSDLDTVETGAFSIKEPRESDPVWSFSEKEKAICVVPAMAYDLTGHRLGYGKGYYDRFLSGIAVTKIGVAYTDFVVKSLPRGRFDLASDIIVTDTGIITPR